MVWPPKKVHIYFFKPKLFVVVVYLFYDPLLNFTAGMAILNHHFIKKKPIPYYRSQQQFLFTYHWVEHCFKNILKIILFPILILTSQAWDIDFTRVIFISEEQEVKIKYILKIFLKKCCTQWLVNKNYFWPLK